jgi:hypothetical protein
VTDLLPLEGPHWRGAALSDAPRSAISWLVLARSDHSSTRSPSSVGRARFFHRH